MTSVHILQKETYLAMIRNSIGSHLWRNLYAEVDGVKKDIADNGQISCAFYVSSILHHFKLIDAPYATVTGLAAAMERSGWEKAETPKEGCVIVWEAQQQRTGQHPHVGFYIGNDEAVSHSDVTQSPAVHHITMGMSEDSSPKRRISGIYTHAFLES